MSRGHRSLARQITRLAWRTSAPEERAALVVVFIKAVIAAAAVHGSARRPQGATRDDLIELERILAAAQSHLDAANRRQTSNLVEDASAAIASRSSS